MIKKLIYYKYTKKKPKKNIILCILQITTSYVMMTEEKNR